MAKTAKDKINEVNEELGYLEDQLLTIADSLSRTIKDAIDDIRDGSEGVAQVFEKKLTKDIKSIAKDSGKFLKNTQKLRDGTAKVADIQKQIKDNELKQADILRTMVVLRNKGVITNDQMKNQLDELNLAYGVQNELLAQQLVDTIKLEETLGLTGKVLNGISKIPFLRDIVDTKKALKEAAKSSTKIGAMASALKSIGGDIAKNITDPLTVLSFITKNLYDFLVGADKQAGEFAKSMNISYSDAVELRGELKKVADNVGDAFVNSRSMSESLMAINSALGTSARLSDEELVTFTKLREEAGYTNEELASIERLTLATGGNLKNNVKSFAGTVQLMNAQNKLSINEKQLMKDISKVSDAIKLSVGGTVENIAKAAFKAKQFGINLEQADKISEGLLNFEESMTNEISAQLLTGKDLNLEHARLLALNGDIAGASAEILEQVGGAAEFSNMNRIQQEAIAKAVGLSRDELAKSLVDREALAKLGAQEGTLQEQYNKLKEEGLTQEQIAAKLGDASLAKQLEQTANAEKMQASIEKLKEAFIPIAEQILPKINSALEWFGKNIDTIKDVIFAIGTFMATKMVASFALNAFQATAVAEASVATAIANQMTNQALVRSAVAAGTLAAEEGAAAIASSETALASLTTAGALTGGIGLIPIMAAVATAAGAFFALRSMKDGKIDYDKGPVVSGGFGSVQLSKKDTGFFNGEKIIAGTNLGGKGNADNSELAKEIKEIKSILADTLNVDKQMAAFNMATSATSIVVDSTKLGTAVNVGTYQIQ